MNRRLAVCTVMVLVFTATAVCLPPAVPAAQRGYVSDMLILTLRTGPGEDFEPVRTLRSNMAVDILETRDTYTRVLTEQGEEGWVESQFITLKTPPTQVIERLEGTIADLEKANMDLLQSRVPADSALEALKSEFAQARSVLETTVKALEEEKGVLLERLAVAEQQYQDLAGKSETVIQTTRENQELKEMNTALEHALTTIRNERSDLFRTSFIQWFLVGAGVLFVGWLIGRSMGGRKRSSGLLG